MSLEQHDMDAADRMTERTRRRRYEPTPEEWAEREREYRVRESIESEEAEAASWDRRWALIASDPSRPLPDSRPRYDPRLFGGDRG